MSVWNPNLFYLNKNQEWEIAVCNDFSPETETNSQLLRYLTDTFIKPQFSSTIPKTIFNVDILKTTIIMRHIVGRSDNIEAIFLICRQVDKESAVTVKDRVSTILAYGIQKKNELDIYKQEVVNLILDNINENDKLSFDINSSSYLRNNIQHLIYNTLISTSSCSIC